MRKKPSMIGFEIPDADKKRLADLAAKNGRSVSAEMRIALARHLKAKGGAK
jgi:plasmid stability protein